MLSQEKCIFIVEFRVTRSANIFCGTVAYIMITRNYAIVDNQLLESPTQIYHNVTVDFAYVLGESSVVDVIIRKHRVVKKHNMYLTSV